MKWRVPLFDLDYGKAEEKAVARVIRDRWLSFGPKCKRFEAQFAAMHGARRAVMVSSGTAGLQLAYRALGIKNGVDFAVPSMTFVATANAGVVLGGRPVFCDIESVQRPTIDVRDLAKKLTPRTKVVAAVHYGGYPADVRRLAKFCRDKGLALVEDCAHCPDTRVGKKHLGLWGDAGVFSFFSNKNLSTGEGGAILTDDDALADELRGLRSHGMTTLSWERYRGAAIRYDILNAGYNFRPTELTGALALTQLRKLRANRMRRENLVKRYRRSLKKDGRAGIPFAAGTTPTAHHLMAILLPRGADKDSVIIYMKKDGIQTSVHYRPIHEMTAYRRAAHRLSLPVTEEYGRRELTLPLYPKMKMSDVNLVCESLFRALDRQDCEETKP